MNLLTKFEGIIEKYGYGTLVVHQDKTKRCSCYEPKTQSTKRDCSYCYGLGYVSTVKKHFVRELDSNVPMSFPFINASNLYGDMAIATRAYFFKRDVDLTENDLIINVDWNGEVPTYSGKGIYQITHIDPQRFEKGELIFYKVYVRDNPVNKTIRGINILDGFKVPRYSLEFSEELS